MSKEQFKKQLHDMNIVKKTYTKRFNVSSMEKMEAIAKEMETDVTKVMELAFVRFIEEYGYE